jgi:hypothetical protein
MAKIGFLDFSVRKDDDIQAFAREVRERAKPRHFDTSLSATVSKIIQDVRG